MTTIRDGIPILLLMPCLLAASAVAAPPPAPGGFTANAVSSAQIDLSWTDVIGETGYQIRWQAGKATSPTAANVKAGKYPISQRLTLYVSPLASQTTRDFVKFVLSGAADEVFTKHGLMPAPRAAAKK